MTAALRLLLVFTQIGLFSIGGGYAVIPLIQEQVVDKYGWVTQQAFADIITISQMTPGPLAVNASTFVGIRIAGVPGALAATLGCISGGVALSLAIYRFFQRHSQSRWALEVLHGLKLASAGLILSAAATILLLTLCGTTSLRLVGGFDVAAAVIFLVSVAAQCRWKTNPIALMAAAGLAGYLVYGLGA